MNSSTLMTFLPLVLLIFIMYFLLIRPQKKREKAVNAMRSAIKVGDDIITIGGICGKVVKTKDETLIIQVGADKTKFEIMRWSVSKVVGDEPAAASKKTAPVEEEPEEAPKKSLPKRMGKPSKPVAEAPVVEAEAETKTETVELEAEKPE
ncbi:MAG: preprotein translocase subunit YajC [Anaerovorax sp.]